MENLYEPRKNEMLEDALKREDVKVSLNSMEGVPYRDKHYDEAMAIGLVALGIGLFGGQLD